MTDLHDEKDIHARLCAYHLGELDDAERAEIERMLLTDPDLAGRLARIEATVGLVSAAFDTSDALSDRARAELLDAAYASAPSLRRKPGRLPWAAGLAAAALVSATVGFLGARQHPRVIDATRTVAMDTRVDRSVAEFEEPDSTIQDPVDAVEEPVVASTESFLSDMTPGLEDPAGLALTTQGVVFFSTHGKGTVDASPPAVTARIERVLRTAGAAPNPPVPARSTPSEHAQSMHAGLPVELERSAALLDELASKSPASPGTNGASTATGASANPAVIRLYRAVDAKPDGSALGGTALQGNSVAWAPLHGIDPTILPYLDGDIDVDVAQGAFSLEFPVKDFRLDAGFTVADFVTPAPSADAILSRCRRLPNETPPMMFFRFWGDNAFLRAAIDPLSTFGADVDTASYALARAYLASGRLPEKAQVRTEEFVNYFKPDLAPPRRGDFAIYIDAAKSLFGSAPNQVLLRVGLRGREVPRVERPPQRLTFVVDTSGSMREQNRIELVKHGLRLLLTQLDERDAIAVISFANESRVVLPMTPVHDRATIEIAIDGLAPDGSTNAEAGLKLGYEVATQHVGAESISRVILLSDGVANVGQTDQDRINADVDNQRAAGIYLNTVGVGMGNHNDVFLEQLADHGDGVCNYVDSQKEAKRALVDNFTSAMVPIARDVKIQVEFDPAQVARYRLLGYENRAIADQDFRNDAVDGGEIGAGHQVVALYEIEPVGESFGPGAVCTARVRYKQPRAGDAEVTELQATFDGEAAQASFDGASPGYRRAALVAQFAEFLRRSKHAEDDSFDLLVHESGKLARELGDADPDFAEFAALVSKSRELIASSLPSNDPLVKTVDALRENAQLRAELEDLARDEESDVLKELEEQNRKLEERIRELLERRRNR